MNLLKVFAILILSMKEFYDARVMSGEKCQCIKVNNHLEMSCLEKSSTPKILNLNEIDIQDNFTYLTVRMENKIYEGIKTSHDQYSLKIINLTVINNIKKILEANSFENLKNLFTLDLHSNSMEELQPKCFNGLNSTLQHILLHLNILKFIQYETFSTLVNLRVLWLQQNQIESIESNALFLA